MTPNPAPPIPAELLELLAIPGVSGFETPVVDWLAARLPAGEPDLNATPSATWSRASAPPAPNSS